MVCKQETYWLRMKTHLVSVNNWWKALACLANSFLSLSFSSCRCASLDNSVSRSWRKMSELLVSIYITLFIRLHTIYFFIEVISCPLLCMWCGIRMVSLLPTTLTIYGATRWKGNHCTNQTQVINVCFHATKVTYTGHSSLTSSTSFEPKTN